MDCCGCGACVDICPKNCITLEPDINGFLYPNIAKDKCIECNLCKTVCPINYVFQNYEVDSIRALVGVSKQQYVIFKSSSGGAFTSIYQFFINQGYCVYGVKWGNNYKVIYDCATDFMGCENFRKSKYILSDTNHLFAKIEDQLKKGEKVLFSGTPCHCAALRLFLDVKRIPHKNIFFVDIICHGAPNQKIFDSYIEELNRKNRKNVRTFTFRNKIPYKGNVNSRTAEIKYDDETNIIVDVKTDPFLRGYYNRLFYRKSCGECIFANINRVSDITIGDAWHIEDLYPEWDSHSGISLILLNTERAQNIADEVLKDMYCKEVTLDWVIHNNSQFKKPTTMHKNRDLFFMLYRTEGFCSAVDKCISIPKVSLIKRFLKKIMLRT